MPPKVESIAALLRDQSRSIGHKPAIESETGEILTYGDLLEKTSQIAACLIAANIPTIKKRPRIGIVLPNGSNLAIALLGAAFVAEAAPFFTGSTPSEFDLYFQSAQIDALLVMWDEKGPVVGIAKKREIPLLRLASDCRIVGHDLLPTPDFLAHPDDIALVLMTSGSTGRSKLVPLSHRNVCTSAADVCRSMKLGMEDRCLSMWEQYHVGGLVDLLLAPLLSGGCIITTKGFNAARFFELLQNRQPTWFQGVPTTLNELVNHAKRNSISCKPNSMRLIRSVAAALSPSLMQDIEMLFDVPVIQTFGMTEAGPLITSTPLPPEMRKPGSVGRSCGAEVRIVGMDGGRLGANVSGEVAIRGANVFCSYEDNEEANRTSFKNGWFHTGDIGYLDADGDLFLTGRIKQMINRGGEKVNPQEVDDALLEHPNVDEAAVFSIRHKTLGEDVGAAVTLKRPVQIEELHAFLVPRLSAFKIPGQFTILDRLPRNPVGKIDRLALARIAEAARAETGHVAPRNELESFLVDLWSRELSVNMIGINDDFSALGGDSLSSMRILIALEEVLEEPVPESAMANFSTIARLAQSLTDSGLVLGGSAKTDSVEVEKHAYCVNTVPVVPLMNELSFEDDQDLSIEKLSTLQSDSELRSLQDAMSVYRTPAELARLIYQLEGITPGAEAEEKPGRMEAFNLRRRHRRWVRQIKSELGPEAGKSSWKRATLANSAYFYTNGVQERDNKTLLVAFTGNQHRLMMPTYRILQNLDVERFDMLMLSDPRRLLFADGIEGLGSDLMELSEFISSFSEPSGFGRIVSIGTSGGGFAALFVALKFGWSRAITVGSACLSDHKQLSDILTRLASDLRHRNTEIFATFSSNSRDADSANQIKEMFPWTALMPDHRFTDHNLLMELFRKGELRQFLVSVLKD